MKLSLPAGYIGANVFFAGAAFAAITPYRAIVGVDLLGMSDAMLGLIIGLNAVGGAAVAVFLGWLSDKVPDRSVLVLLAAVLAACGMVLAWAVQTPLAFGLAFCLLLPFGNALFSQIFSYSRALFDRDYPTRSQIGMSYLRTLFSLAWIIVPPLAGWIAAKTSSYGPFALAAVVLGGSVLFSVLLWSHPDGRIGIEPAPATAAASAPPASAHLPFTFRIGLIGVILAGIAIQLNMTVLPLLIVKDLGGSLADVGINAAAAAAVEVPAMIAWGYIALRIRKETVLAIACGILAAYFGLAGVAETVLQVLLLQGLAGLGIAALLSINISYLQEAIRGRVGLSTSLVDVSRVLAALAAAGIFAANFTPSYGPLMFAGALAALLGAAMMLVARRTRPAD